MVQMLQEKYNLELLGSKNSIKVLRILYQNLHTHLGNSEIAKILGTSRSNVHRTVKKLLTLKIIHQLKGKNKGTYGIDCASPLAVPLFEMFSVEKYYQINPRIKNFIDLFLSDLKDISINGIILFGSVAYGLETSESDVDICIIVTDQSDKDKILTKSKVNYPDIRLEPQIYTNESFEKIPDFVVVEALLNGIPLFGYKYIFNCKTDLKSIDKSYILYRLKKVEEFYKKSLTIDTEEAKEYFEEIMYITLGEIESLLEQRILIPKILIRKDYDIEYAINKLHKNVSTLGDKIWLD